MNNLHIVQSCLSLPEHVEVFERGIASKVDFCFSSGQGARVMNLAAQGKIEMKGIHTYLELYFMDLTPRISSANRYHDCF